MQAGNDTVTAGSTRAPLVPRRAEPLIAALRALGLSPLLRTAGGGIVAGGVSLRLDVRLLLADPTAMQREFGRVHRSLLSGIPVSLTLADGGTRAARRIEQLLTRLRRVLRPSCINPRLLGLAVPATDLPLPAFMLMSKVLLGEGPRYALLDDRHLARPPGSGAADADAAWTALYEQRARRWRLQPAYACDIRTRCPLLSDEHADTVIEPGGLAAPGATAWLPMTFNVCRFVAHPGVLDEQRLLSALRRGVRLADELYDRLLWIDPVQRADARANRRLAIRVTGIADLLERRGDNPSSFACLRFLDRLLARMHHSAWDESHALSTARGLLPALAVRDPSTTVGDDDHRRHWRRRWQEALSTAAVRHRNLLVLSPAAMLPPSRRTARTCLDLLPLLAHADACAFAGAGTFPDWSINEYRLFHRRAFAILRRRSAAGFIAAGV